MFSHHRNTTNNDYTKEFDAYVKVIEYYGGRTPIQPSFVKANITNMDVTDKDTPTPEEKDKAEE